MSRRISPRRIETRNAAFFSPVRSSAPDFFGEKSWPGQKKTLSCACVPSIGTGGTTDYSQDDWCVAPASPSRLGGAWSRLQTSTIITAAAAAADWQK
nr:hypothetical protein CFP56_79351 [Quercus suber]